MPNTVETLPEPLPIDARIYRIRNHSVMLDSDLAELYGVVTGNLNKAVDRNPDRFPEEFAFRLTDDEWRNLIFQIGTSSSWGGRRKVLRVFTEHGAVMLASVLNSSFAVKASIAVVDAFVRIRHVFDVNRELAQKVDELSAQVGDHRKAITVIFRELDLLTQDREPELPREPIGFKPNKERKTSGKTRKRDSQNKR